MIYFDHNATTPLLPEARRAWLDASEQFIGNPSSPHRLGARADVALQNAREQLSRILGCRPSDLSWTSGATESNNAVFHHAAHTLPPGREVWVSAIEHPCVLAGAARYFPGRHRLIPVSAAGVLDLDWLERELGRGQPGLVAVMAANNETGVLQPWREVLQLCRARAVPYLCDAAQWLGKLPGAGLGECDFVSGCAHKFGGPKGVGFLKSPARVSLTPLLVGGPQEDGRRAGTENVAAILSMLAALEHRERQLALGEQQERGKWRDAFETLLLQGIPGCEIVGRPSERLWNTVSAVMPATEDCQRRWVVKLDKSGCAVSTGSACSSGKEQASHVLVAQGFSAAAAGRVLRFSSGWETTASDWAGLQEALAVVWRELQPEARAARG